MRICGQGPAHSLVGLLTIDFDNKHFYLAYGSTANFQFRIPIAKIDISKEREGPGDRSGP